MGRKPCKKNRDAIKKEINSRIKKCFKCILFLYQQNFISDKEYAKITRRFDEVLESL